MSDQVETVGVGDRQVQGGESNSVESPEFREGIALALSGGGYRATLFHLGAIWRLNEMGYLKRLERISSVSGGSILNGCLGVRWSELDFDEGGIATNFEDVIVQPVRDFCARSIDVAAFLIGCLPFVRPSDVLAGFYRRLLGAAKLSDLPADEDGPRIVLNATSLQTGAAARFSRPYVADYKAGVCWGAETTVARAVAASSGFPPFFSPVIVKLRGGKWEKAAGEVDAVDLAELRSRLILCDGGVYDNLGMQTIEKFKTVLVSDAGAPVEIKPNGAGSTWSMAMGALRIVSVMLGQLQARRKVALIDRAKSQARHGARCAYWDVATEIGVYGVSALTRDNETTRRLQKMRTRLNKFTPEEQGQLINWGYALTDAAMRRFVAPDAAPATKWPVPEYPLD